MLPILFFCYTWSKFRFSLKFHNFKSTYWKIVLKNLGCFFWRLLSICGAGSSPAALVPIFRNTWFSGKFSFSREFPRENSENRLDGGGDRDSPNYAKKVGGRRSFGAGARTFMHNFHFKTNLEKGFFTITFSLFPRFSCGFQDRVGLAISQLLMCHTLNFGTLLLIFAIFVCGST
jgi:hypothetical protein